MNQRRVRRSEKRSVVVVEDHPCMRLGVVSLLVHSSHLAVVGEAADGEQAVRVILQRRPQIVVLGMVLPRLDGFGVIRRVLDQLPGVRFIAYSAREEARFVQEVLAAGAADCVFKSSSAGALVEAVERVAVGMTAAGEAIHAVAAMDPSGLSQREVEVLRLLARGERMKEAAAILRIGVRTLETYKRRAMRKLQLHSRMDLIRLAQRAGWYLVSLDETSIGSPGPAADLRKGRQRHKRD